MSKEFFSPATLPPPVGYSHVAKINKGTLIYLAGQVSSDPSGALVMHISSRLNPTAHATAVYASCSALLPPHATPASRRPATTLPGPDLHRLIAPAFAGAFDYSITSSVLAQG